MVENSSPFKSRKFIIAVMLIISAVALTGFNRMDGSQAMVILSLVGGSYGYSNIASKKLDQLPKKDS